jgi:conjugative transfer signal peptidase TraF
MAMETLAAEVGMSPERTRRLALIGSIASVAIATVFVAQVLNQTGRVLLHNASPSEPEGVYLRTSQSPAVGRLVTFMAPASASGYVDRHLSYLRRTPILKAIAAGQGSLVCTTSGRLVIDGRIVAPVSVTDRHGVFLPQWKGCRRLGAGEWFAYSDRIPNSFDSRYYGPIRTDQVIAVYRPLWVGSERAR